MKLPDKFNIRVYGILLNAGKVLLSKEFFKGHSITKFPGGGLQFGEGTIDCLKREFKEEINLELNSIKHFYTTDFYQLSAFNPEHQIISIYYLVSTDAAQMVNAGPAHKFTDALNGNEIYFDWVAIGALTPEKMTFPIDKKVANLLNLDHSL